MEPKVFEPDKAEVDEGTSHGHVASDVALVRGDLKSL